MLKEKYQALLDLGTRLHVKNSDVKTEGGRLRIKNILTNPALIKVEQKLKIPNKSAA